MHQIKYNNFEITLPGSWNELNQNQLLYLAGDFDLWQLLVKNKISLGKTKAFILLCLLNTTPRKIVNASHRFTGLFYSKKNRAIANVIVEANNDELEKLLQLTDFVFKSNTLTHQKLLKLEHAGKIYYGPKSEFENLRFGEFVFAEEYFKAFVATGNEKYLTLMLAVLYRPAKAYFNPEAQDTDGDIREKFNRANVEFRAEKLQTTPRALKIAVMLFYSGCREQMVKDNEAVFQKSETDTTPTKQQSWADLLLKMARNKNVDDEVLEQKLLSTILMELTQISLENLELKKQHGKH